MRNLLVVLAVLGLISSNAYADAAQQASAKQTNVNVDPNPGEETWEGTQEVPVLCEMSYRMLRGAIIFGFGVGEGSVTCTDQAGNSSSAEFEQGEIIEVTYGYQGGIYQEEGKMYFAGVGGHKIDWLARVFAKAALVVGNMGGGIDAGIALTGGTDGEADADVALGVAVSISETVTGFYAGVALGASVASQETPWTGGDQ